MMVNGDGNGDEDAGWLSDEMEEERANGAKKKEKRK